MIPISRNWQKACIFETKIYRTDLKGWVAKGDLAVWVDNQDNTFIRNNNDPSDDGLPE